MSDLPLILIEGVLVFGGALAFGAWQLWSIKRDQQIARERKAAAEAAAPQTPPDDATGAGPPPPDPAGSDTDRR